jgi:phage terminase large subunit-like protein
VRTGTVEIEIEQDGVKRTSIKPTFDAWIEAWTPGDTLKARQDRDKAPYDIWVRDEFLNAPKGSSISYLQVAQAIAEDAHEFNVKCVAYDRYAFKRGLEPECDNLGLAVDFVEHPQGGVKKGQPNEAMKEAAKAADRDAEGLWMPMSVRQLEELILEKRIRIRTNPVLISAMMSAVSDSDRWGNYWLTKERSTQKIDCAIALAMAVGAALSYDGAASGSIYETRQMLMV